MTIDDCYYLGYVAKSRGLKGDFQIFLDVSNPEEYTNLESVFVEINKQLVPFFLEHIQLQPKGKAVIRIEGDLDPQMIKEITGSQLYLPLSLLPPLSGNHFYYHEIKGFMLIDQTFGKIGTIEKVQESTAQDLLVAKHKGKEVLVPLLDDTIVRVDREAKEIEVQTPTGLIELYLSE